MADKKVSKGREMISIPAGYREKMLDKSAELQLKYKETFKISHLVAILVEAHIDKIDTEITTDEVNLVAENGTKITIRTKD